MTKVQVELLLTQNLVSIKLPFFKASAVYNMSFFTVSKLHEWKYCEL